MSDWKQQVRVQLETVTPLFLGGADPRGEPELRPPAFRGAMRYWFRAALGGVIGDSFEDIQKVEGQIFGSTVDPEKSVYSSEIALRLTPASSFRSFSLEKHANETGKNYFFWSLFASGKPERGNYQPPKKFFPSGEKFDLQISQRPFTRSDNLTYAFYSLWLLVHLGGLGSRSRRMGGSLRFSNAEEVKGLKLQLNGGPQEVATALGEGLTLIRMRFKEGFGDLVKSFKGFSEFDVIHPNVCRIWVLGIWTSWESALNDVGMKMQQFRTRREPDHINVANWLNGRSIKTVERTAFGLPIVYRYSSGLNGVIQAVVKHDSKDNLIKRRASPLWLSLTRTNQGYLAVATLFKSNFLPHDAQLTVKNRTKPIPPPDNYTLIETWVKQNFDAIEVKYD